MKNAVKKFYFDRSNAPLGERLALPDKKGKDVLYIDSKTFDKAYENIKKIGSYIGKSEPDRLTECFIDSCHVSVDEKYSENERLILILGSAGHRIKRTAKILGLPLENKV
jgi:hypothetical protein